MKLTKEQERALGKLDRLMGVSASFIGESEETLQALEALGYAEWDRTPPRAFESDYILSSEGLRYLEMIEG